MSKKQLTILCFLLTLTIIWFLDYICIVNNYLHFPFVIGLVAPLSFIVMFFKSIPCFAISWFSRTNLRRPKAETDNKREK